MPFRRVAANSFDVECNTPRFIASLCLLKNSTSLCATSSQKDLDIHHEQWIWPAAEMASSEEKQHNSIVGTELWYSKVFAYETYSFVA
jgi:hypothetical protein